jgi:predicted anti-sigma-YlaC factor YlaD
MLSCKELTEIATDYLESKLSFWQRLRVKEHLWRCRPCRIYIDQMRKLVRMLKSLPTDPVSPEITEQIVAKLKYAAR